MKIALIPAKFNSSRIKNKNFKLFQGKPMIYWSIKSARASNLFDKIIVSTDSSAIENKLLNLGVDVFIRPKKLSQERIGIRDVVVNFLKSFNSNTKIDYLCCIFPCAPLLLSSDIKESFRKVKNKKNKFVFTASNFSHPIEKSFKIKNNKINMNFGKKYFRTSSKFLTDSFHDVGYLYWAKPKVWLKNDIDYQTNCSFIKIPNWRAQDMDTSDDLKKIELIFKSLKTKKNFKKTSY